MRLKLVLVAPMNSWTSTQEFSEAQWLEPGNICSVTIFALCYLVMAPVRGRVLGTGRNRGVNMPHPGHATNLCNQCTVESP